MFSKVFNDEQISMVSAWNYVFMFERFSVNCFCVSFNLLSGNDLLSVIPGDFNDFIDETIKWNISKIKHADIKY